MAGTLRLRTVAQGRAVEARRDDEVSDGFWLALRAAWGSQGATPGRAVVVPIEEFLAHLAWLAPACRLHGVGIDWGDDVRELVGASREEKRVLRELMQGVPALDDREVLARLEGSRFARADELRDFQVRDLGHLLALAHGANFSVPGAGKTAVQYGAYEAEHDAGRLDRMLVVAPLSAFDSWINEARNWFDDSPVVQRYGGGAINADTEVLLVNYQRLTNDYPAIAEWVSAGRTLVVLDEAHRMKRGWAGEWGSACLRLAYLAQRRDILSGTPAPQSTRDMEALVDFIWPNQARSVLPEEAFRADPPPNAGHLVAQRIRPLFVRTTKNELGLRKPEMTVVSVDLTGLHRQIYDALRDEYVGIYRLGTRDRRAFSEMGDVTMYLLEAATNPALLPSGSSTYDAIEFRHPPLAIPADSALAQLIQEYAQYETPEKFKQLAGLIAENAALDRKTLVWSNFVRNLETLKKMLGRFEPAMIHGGVPSEISQPLASPTREQEIGRFRGEDACQVLLANPAAMSEGLSLHDVCHDAIYLDRTFNAGQYLQSLDRIHRLGLRPEDETRITFLISEDTIDTVVNDRVETKAVRLGEMLDDADIATMALPEDDDYGTAIDLGDDGDVAALFAHLRGEEVAV